MVYFVCCALVSMCVYTMIGLILTAVLLKVFPPHSGIVTFQGILFSAACWPVYPYVYVTNAYQAIKHRRKRKGGR